MFSGFYAKPYSLWQASPAKALSFEELSLLQADVPEGEKHWEFVAMAMLHARGYARETCSLTDTDRETLRKLLTRCVLNHHAANWRLMRAVLESAVANRATLSYEGAAKGLVVLPDGQLEDIPGDRSTQYHAYLLHLLMRFGDSQCSMLREIVKNAFGWLIRADAAYGDPNARGRGQFQLFGYVSMAVCAQEAPRWDVTVPKTWEERVYARISHEPESGAIPLFWDTPLRKEMLLGYNTCDDYPAFARFWVGLEVEPKADLTLDGVPFVYALEGKGFVLADADSGPFLAIEPQSEAPNKVPGIKAAAKEVQRSISALWHQAVLRWRPAEPAEKLAQRVEAPLELADWNVKKEVDRGIVRWVLTPRGESLSRVLPTIWVSPALELDVAASRMGGSAELENLSWERYSRWDGFMVRVVRKAEVKLVFKEVL